MRIQSGVSIPGDTLLFAAQGDDPGYFSYQRHLRLLVELYWADLTPYTIHTLSGFRRVRSYKSLRVLKSENTNVGQVQLSFVTV